MDSTLKEILKNCIDLAVVQERARRDQYVELVFPTKETDQWAAKIQESLGEASKPPGQSATKEQEKITKDFGGIQKGQTLFCKSRDEEYIIAMFWPWGNGEHTTLKLAIAQAPKKGFFNIFSH
jgi:hypothetical protein